MQRWLLLLGSNEAEDTVLEQALAALLALGGVRCVCRRYLPPRSGDGGWYHNALVILDMSAPLPVEALRPQLRGIEAALGRDRSQLERVRIDLDILALADGDDWLADAHALEKGDIERYPTPLLLQAAGVAVRTAG